MIQVKICGITHLEDAMCAAQNGVAALGFIFYPPSPRYIDPRAAAAIIDNLPENLVKVGVFVNEEAQTVRKVFNDCRLDMIQLHGDESHEYCGQFPKDRIIKVLELKSNAELNKAVAYSVAAILVDSRHKGLYGGTGRTSNWDTAKRLSQPLILSGGLNEVNVMDALQKVHPAALDINSGVEAAPGKKDHMKIARIMQMINTSYAPSKGSDIFTRRENK